MTDATLTAIESIVRDAVVDRTAMAPAELAELLTVIDYRERIVATREELDACLGRLVAARLIGELDEQRYLDGRSASAAHVHTEIREAEYAAAVSDYRRNFRIGRDAGAAEASREPPTDRHLLVTVPTATGHEPTTDDWQTGERLAVRMCQLLADRGRRAAGDRPASDRVLGARPRDRRPEAAAGHRLAPVRDHRAARLVAGRETVGVVGNRASADSVRACVSAPSPGVLSAC